MSNNNDELWLECKTPGANSRLYYINKATGKVSWTKPSSSNIQSATSKSATNNTNEEEKKTTPPKSKLRWGALRGVVKNSGDTSNNAVNKSNAVIKGLLAKARRNSGITNDEDKNTKPSTPSPRKKSLSSFSLNKSKYQEALARARKLAESITPVKNSDDMDNVYNTDSNNSNNNYNNYLGTDDDMEVSDDVKAILETGAKQLNRAKRVLTEWKKKTIGRWFKKWQINSVHILAEQQQKQMEDKLKQSENKIKLNNAKSELALARMEVDAWRRAKKEKDALVRKMATKSLQKVKAKLSNQVRWGFEKWVKFLHIHQKDEVTEVNKTVKKTTRDLNAYKAAIKEEKKRRRAAEKTVKELQALLEQEKQKVQDQLEVAVALVQSKSKDKLQLEELEEDSNNNNNNKNENTILRKVSSISSNASSLDDTTVNTIDSLYSQIEQLELEKKDLKDALEEANENNDNDNNKKKKDPSSSSKDDRDRRKLQNENNRLKIQVERLTQECNRLIAEQKVKMQEFNRKLKGANIVSLEKYEELKVMADHYKSLSDEREEQFKQLAEEHTTERNKWMARFSMQQETIEGLENDVEELSELKVLELAENYYVSTQNGYA